MSEADRVLSADGRPGLEPHEGWRWRRRAVVMAAVVIAGLAVAMLVDRWVFHAMYVGSVEAKERLERSDLYRTFRVAGSVWPWLVVSALLAACGMPSSRGAGRVFARVRGPLLLLVPIVLAGGVAELLRGMIGRLRPDATDGVYRFRWFFTGLDEPLGMPSSHAAVAFAAAFSLMMMWPGRGGWVVVGVAAGCAVTRLLAGAHFLSDVYVSMVLGWIAAWVVHRHDRRTSRVPGA